MALPSSSVLLEVIATTLVALPIYAAVSLPDLTFDNDDTSTLELALERHAQFAMIVDATSDFVVLALNDTAANITVNVDGAVVVDGAHSAGLAFVVVQPRDTTPLCALNVTSCTTTIVLESGGVVPLKMRAFRDRVLQPDQTIFDVVQKTKTKRYAVEIKPNLLPALISTRPDVSELKMDVDMFVYAESDPFKFLFPNVNNRNHRWNYAEEFPIDEDMPFWAAGLYIIEVYASCDTAFDLNDYAVTVYSQVDNGLVLTLIGMAMALFLALAGVVFMLAVVHQHRRRVLRALRLQQLAGRRQSGSHPARAATKEQIDAIPIVDLSVLNLDKDDAKCSICLCEYTASDKLRKIACAHHFHSECLLEWLLKSVQCPLCQQNVSQAKDRRSPRQADSANSPAGSATPSLGVEAGAVVTSLELRQTDRYQPLQESTDDARA